MMAKMAIDELEKVLTTVNYYVEGLRTGSIETAKKGFHEDASMFGFNNVSGYLGGPIQNLWDFMEKAGAAPNVKSRVDILAAEDTTASVRVYLEHDAYDDEYTDFLILLKADGEWKITSKLFHLHQ
ncbi:nuclear transport factor 2 family protein [Enterococcus sp. AZ109]|uniref:nuclear transport factor 2 family protein n=1 Tax=Enterococcus sp. AZ109 TaxID=2774634 RepID=UPI003F2343F4